MMNCRKLQRIRSIKKSFLQSMDFSMRSKVNK